MNRTRMGQAFATLICCAWVCDGHICIVFVLLFFVLCFSFSFILKRKLSFSNTENQHARNVYWRDHHIYIDIVYSVNQGIHSSHLCVCVAFFQGFLFYWLMFIYKTCSDTGEMVASRHNCRSQSCKYVIDLLINDVKKTVSVMYGSRGGGLG